jgi:hypothetical protein
MIAPHIDKRLRRQRILKRGAQRMEEWHLGIYLMEVERQCKFLLLATDEIERGLKGNEYNHTWYAPGRGRERE